MARPIKNNLEYFSHDNSMRNDRKVKALRAKFGLIGYAVYSMLLEILCEAELLIIKWDKIEIELISGDLNIVSDELIQVKEYLCEINLLKSTNGYVFCPQLDMRSKQVFDKRTTNLDDLRKINDINIAETDVSGVKSTQRKVKDIILKERKLFYDAEIKKSNNDLKYTQLTKILFGDNIYSRPLNAVLKMDEQITFEQFTNMLKLKKEYNVEIKDILESMEGWKDLRKNKTVLGTFRTFCKPKPK